ncbi:MAG: glycosyltransferase family 39 protein [Deltaproteobacteria bacterium]|nr:glycosyltransferase family 39 protein [Deltaproteobacteria bacterium]
MSPKHSESSITQERNFKLQKYQVFLLIFISICIQLVYFALFQANPMERDAIPYYDIATHLFSDHGFYLNGVPNVRRPPIYPLFMGIILYFSNHHLEVVRYGQIVLNTITVLGVYVLGSHFISKKQAMGAAYLVLFFPPFTLMSFYFVSEGLATFLLMGVVCTCFLGLKKNKMRFLVCAGLLLALFSLTRPVGLFLMPWLGGLFFFVFPVKRALKQSVAMGLPFLLVVGMWVVRNYHVTHHFIPVTIGADIELWNGSYLPGKGEMEHPLTVEARKKIFEEFGSVPYFDQFKGFRRKALQNIRENPVGYLSLFPRKFLRLYIGSYGFILNSKVSFQEIFREKLFKKSFSALLFKGTMVMLSVVFLILGVMGMLRVFKIEGHGWLWIGVFVYWTLIHLPFSPIQRFSLPLIPLLILFSVVYFGVNRNQEFTYVQ